jgi:hypothetical protein
MHRDLSILKAEMFVQLVAKTMHPGERNNLPAQAMRFAEVVWRPRWSWPKLSDEQPNVIGIRSIENFDGSLSLSLLLAF